MTKKIIKTSKPMFNAILSRHKDCFFELVPSDSSIVLPTVGIGDYVYIKDTTNRKKLRVKIHSFKSIALESLTEDDIISLGFTRSNIMKDCRYIMSYWGVYISGEYMGKDFKKSFFNYLKKYKKEYTIGEKVAIYGFDF